jgi:hypothetical protein
MSMDENPYRAPQERPLAAPAANEHGPRYESVGQRLISVALLLFVFLGLFVPTMLLAMSSNFGDAGRAAIGYAAWVGAFAWLGAVVWLIYRVIRRLHRS